jgi:hypothetical protein
MVLINPIILSRTHYFRHAYHPTRDNIIRTVFCVDSILIQHSTSRIERQKHMALTVFDLRLERAKQTRRVLLESPRLRHMVSLDKGTPGPHSESPQLGVRSALTGFVCFLVYLTILFELRTL